MAKQRTARDVQEEIAEIVRKWIPPGFEHEDGPTRLMRGLLAAIVRMRLALLKLSPEMQNMVEEGQMSVIEALKMVKK